MLPREDVFCREALLCTKALLCREALLYLGREDGSWLWSQLQKWCGLYVEEQRLVVVQERLQAAGAGVGGTVVAAARAATMTWEVLMVGRAAAV
jgi:hypothetical protein